ncbi:MAG: type 2 isopentenyl-diphosphate Delta-isomerase [Bacteroidota bacterium]
MGIKNRKKDHVQLTITESTQYQKTSGFERFDFVHNALPEVNLQEVSAETPLLGRLFSLPLFISSMTGGYSESGPVNAIIAEFCEEVNLPFGVGSQRAMLEHDDVIPTFSVVREKAPTAFICSNIGGVQLVEGWKPDYQRRMLDAIRADALIVHLNPLQELMQPEGDQNFKGVLFGIEQLVSSIHIPVIVKETGAGITESVARRLLNAGVSAIDVAGAGGTSWAMVENQRKSNQDPYYAFDNWGIPTAECITQLAELEWEQSFEIIGSGGIRTSFDMTKALCLGAHFTATAQPIIKAIHNDGLEGLMAMYSRWEQELRMILCLLGCTSPTELNRSHLYEIFI